MKTLIAPRVNLNGDTKQSLQQSLIDACHAIKEAQAKLRDTAPNARNFYVIGTDAYSRARNEHMDRAERLQSVYDDLFDLFEAIDDGQIETAPEEVAR